MIGDLRDQKDQKDQRVRGLDLGQVVCRISSIEIRACPALAAWHHRL